MKITKREEYKHLGINQKWNTDTKTREHFNNEKKSMIIIQMINKT